MHEFGEFYRRQEPGLGLFDFLLVGLNQLATLLGDNTRLAY